MSSSSSAASSPAQVDQSGGADQGGPTPQRARKRVRDEEDGQQSSPAPAFTPPESTSGVVPHSEVRSEAPAAQPARAEPLVPDPTRSELVPTFEPGPKRAKEAETPASPPITQAPGLVTASVVSSSSSSSSSRSPAIPIRSPPIPVRPKFEDVPPTISAAVGPSTSIVEASADQPTGWTLALDVYVARYRARDVWTVRQLGLDLAQEELRWWQGVHRGEPAIEPAAVALTGEAHARMMMLTTSDDHGHASESLAAPVVEDVQALDACAKDLLAVIISVLGRQQVISCWDVRRKRHVVRRELVRGFEPRIAMDAAGSQTRDRAGDSAGYGRRTAAMTAAPSAAALPGRLHEPVIPDGRSQPQLRGEALYKALELQPSSTIREIYSAGRVRTASGELRRIASAVSPREGMHMFSIVQRNHMCKTLEVGMANGLSSLYLCQALANNKLNHMAASYSHVSVDPFQTTQWDNAAREGLRRAGLSDLSRVMEEPSYLALPQLVREGAAGTFDLVFIDGMHLFDFTLIDLFYADLLTKVGGVILVDDIRMPSVAQVVDYVTGNYKHLRLVKDTICADTLATFVKVGSDTRSWDFHRRIGGH